jgi:TDP-4-amino-4,6-dideoxy-D-glucose deaminase
MDGAKANMDPVNIFAEKLPSNLNKELWAEVLKTIFLKPYLPSKNLLDAHKISKRNLMEIYSFIRNSSEAIELFKYSPYPFLISLLSRLTKDSDRTSTVLQGKVPFPLWETMELFISNVCNANCKFCYRNGKTYESSAFISGSRFVQLINEFADSAGRNLDISGGLEPLLSPSINDVLRAGVDRKLNVGLYTNGIALNVSKTVNEIMKINRVRISLNAFDRKSYKEIMGVDTFDCVIRNIENLVRVREKSKSTVKIGISFVVHAGNYKDIYRIIQLAQDLQIDFLGLRSVEVVETSNFGKSRKSELREILDRVRYENYNGRFGKLNVSVADTLSALADSSFEGLKYVKKEIVNALPYFRITVTPSGKFYALNLIGQPSRSDNRYLLGELSEGFALSDLLKKNKPIPFEPGLLLAHDFSLIMALSKLQSDLEFGIDLENNPFNWA